MSPIRRTRARAGFGGGRPVKHYDAKDLERVAAVKKAENACDFCGTLVRRASDMFNRLDWKYCSSACVQKHQRELAAAAVMARLGK